MSAPAVIGLDLSITATGICDVFGDTFTVGGPSDPGEAPATPAGRRLGNPPNG